MILRRQPRRQVTFFVLAATAAALCAAPSPAQLRADATSELTPLDHYVASPDPHYRWEVVHDGEGELDGKAYSFQIVDLTSQAWLTAEQVDRPVWKHWLVVVVPAEIEHDTAMLFIGGGSNDDPMPEAPSPLIVAPALATGSITAELRMVPNQPITFAGDEFGPRKEDELIAYGWDQFLRGGARDHDALWLARLPMTKAAVRAMDTLQALFPGEGGQSRLSGFVVAGGSKRGWTTWTTAAVDDRVVAIAPMVIDLLNVEPSFQHHWRAYGFWAPAVYDYRREGIMEWQGRPEYRRLLEITEPYSYRQRLAEIPKYLINAAGDEFFLPDSWKFYWHELPGEKHLRYVANGNHSLAGTDVAESFVGFYRSVLEDGTRPEVDWSAEDGVIVVRTDPGKPPTKIELWTATNPTRRDFRVVTIKRTWEAEEIAPRQDGVYRLEIAEPEEGWKAAFVELTYAGEGPEPMKVTTGTLVVPETLPFPEYEPDRSDLPAPAGSSN